MHRRVVGAGLVVTLVAAGLAASAAPAVASSASHMRFVLAPNHHISAKGGSGSKGGSGISWPGWASSNWSGYAIAGGGYASAAGQWTVPTPAKTKSGSYSAAWVGVGGFNTADLIQTGTEQDFYNGSAHYAAWWTTSDLGYAEQVIPGITVHAGDAITASVTNNNDGTWTLSFTDAGQPTFNQTVTFDSSESSAEWIMEAPGLGGRTAPIAHYGTDVFDNGTVNGSDPGFGITDGGILVQKSAVVSIPSTPDTGHPNPGDGFAISYGSQQPTAPKT